MTAVLEQPAGAPSTDGPRRTETTEDTDPAPTPTSAPEPIAGSPGDTRRAVRHVVLWLLALVASYMLVVYGFGPYFHQRDQHQLISSYRATIERSANEATGLGGVTVPVTAPGLGDPVGILEIGAIRLQAVVVEGVGASQTRAGPGHVPGTAGLGQPGNAVVVGRRAEFGADFHRLGSLRKGDQIVVTTTQGQSVYEVETVQTTSSPPGAPSTGSPTDTGSGSSAPTVTDVYGPSTDDRLTLITSASTLPFNSSKAVLVTAKIKTVPFAATPQGGLVAGSPGTGGDDNALAAVVLATLAYGVVLAYSVVMFRRAPFRTAYLLTVGPILAVTIINAETLSRVFPAWG